MSPGATDSTGVTKATIKADGDDEAHALKVGGYDDIKRLPDVTYGGSLFYHLQYTNEGRSVQDAFGTETADGRTAIGFEWDLLAAAVNRQQADKLIGSVMSTFTLL